MDNAIKVFAALSQSLNDPDPVFQTHQDDFYLQVIQTTKTHFFCQLLVDYKQHFAPKGPELKNLINASIDDVYFNRLFDPGDGHVGQDCSPFVNVDTKIFA
eukprot:3674049-Ditylum_brightwellii.AAC.1